MLKNQHLMCSQKYEIQLYFYSYFYMFNAFHMKYDTYGNVGINTNYVTNQTDIIIMHVILLLHC